MSPRRDGPATYRIRVRGWIGSRWENWLEGMAITPAGEPDLPGAGDTWLAGAVIDQAALLGLLQKLHNLSLLLLELQRVEGAPPAAPRAVDEEG